MELTTKKEWNLKINGINCNIVFWVAEYMKNDDLTYPHGGTWNSYIFIDRKSIPENFDNLIKIKSHGKDFGNRKYFDYGNIPFDMASGITFLEAIRNVSGKIVKLKIGNDYNHIWNKDEFINENTIKGDLEKVVNDILNMFPNYKVRSHIDGNYVPYKELGEYNKKAHAKLFNKNI